MLVTAFRAGPQGWSGAFGRCGGTPTGPAGVAAGDCSAVLRAIPDDLLRRCGHSLQTATLGLVIRVHVAAAGVDAVRLHFDTLDRTLDRKPPFGSHKAALPVNAERLVSEVGCRGYGVSAMCEPGTREEIGHVRSSPAV